MLRDIRRASWKKKFAAVSLLLLLAATTKVILTVRTSNAALSQAYSDHFSHDQATVLFLYRGIGVWDPILQTCNHPDDFPNQPMPPASTLHDHCFLRERAGKPPLDINWSQVPRAYPPGLFIYSLPEALMFEAGWLDNLTQNRITMIKYAAGCMVLLWFLAQLFFGHPVTSQERSPWDRWAWPLAGLVLFPILASEALQWSLLGFYDPLAVAFGVAAGLAAGRRRWVRSMLWLSLAIFSHYRLLWYLPLGAVAAWHRWQERRPLDRGERRELVAAAILTALSFGAFALLWPHLRTYPAENPLRFGEFLAPRHLHFWVPVAAVVAWQAWRRDWLQVMCSSWLVLMLYQTQQYRAWHTLALIPTVAVAYAQGGKLRHLVSAALLIAIASLCAFYHAPSERWLSVYTALLTGP